MHIYLGLIGPFLPMFDHLICLYNCLFIVILKWLHQVQSIKKCLSATIILLYVYDEVILRIWHRVGDYYFLVGGTPNNFQYKGGGGG